MQTTWSGHNRWDNIKKDDIKLTRFSLSGSVSYTASKYGWGTGPVFLTNVACAGSEDSLAECSHSYFGDVTSSCKDHSKDASVYCGSKHCGKIFIIYFLDEANTCRVS